MALYDNVKRECEKAGITIMELERRCGLQRSYICKWNVTKPSFDKVKKVAEELGITFEELMAE